MARASYDSEDEDIDAIDLKEQQEWAAAALQTYQDQPLIEQPMIATVTDNSRNRNIERWK